jgi:hypothetical protein
MVYNTNELKEGVLNGYIPSACADSAATSSIGTKKDQSRNTFVLSRWQPDKAFRMLNRAVEEATAMDKLHRPTTASKDVHIVPAIEHNSLISIPKFANAYYIAIIDKDEANIFDANNTKITVTRAAILQGWCCNQTKLWHIPLVKHIQNNNTKTVLCNRPPTEFLPEQCQRLIILRTVQGYFRRTRQGQTQYL